MTEVKHFWQCVIKQHATGSNYICNPPVVDTDIDTVFLVNGYYDYAALLVKDGWEDCGKQYEGHKSEFQAFRKGKDNYIVTEDPLFYWSYVKATEGAKALNLTNKDDRIKLFQTICNTSINGLVEAPTVYDDKVLINRLPEINWRPIPNINPAREVLLDVPDFGEDFDEDFDEMLDEDFDALDELAQEMLDEEAEAQRGFN